MVPYFLILSKISNFSNLAGPKIFQNCFFQYVKHQKDPKYNSVETPNLKVALFFFFFFLHPPSSGISPCVGTTEVVPDSTLDAALLFCSEP